MIGGVNNAQVWVAHMRLEPFAIYQRVGVFECSGQRCLGVVFLKSWRNLSKE
jgi:hypothetical protein